MNRPKHSIGRTVTVLPESSTSSSKKNEVNAKPYNSSPPTRHYLQYNGHPHTGPEDSLPYRGTSPHPSTHLFVNYPVVNGGIGGVGGTGDTRGGRYSDGRSDNNATVGYEHGAHTNRPKSSSAAMASGGRREVRKTDLNSSRIASAGTRGGVQYPIQYSTPIAFQELDMNEQGNGLKLPSMGYRPKTAGDINTRDNTRVWVSEAPIVDRNAAIIHQMLANEVLYKYPNDVIRFNLQEANRVPSSVVSRGSEPNRDKEGKPLPGAGRPVVLHDYRSHLSPKKSRLPPQPVATGVMNDAGSMRKNEEGKYEDWSQCAPTYMQHDNAQMAKRTSFVRKKFNDGPPRTQSSTTRHTHTEHAVQYNLVSGLVEER